LSLQLELFLSPPLQTSERKLVSFFSSRDSISVLESPPSLAFFPFFPGEDFPPSPRLSSARSLFLPSPPDGKAPILQLDEDRVSLLRISNIPLPKKIYFACTVEPLFPYFFKEDPAPFL